MVKLWDFKKLKYSSWNKKMRQRLWWAISIVVTIIILATAVANPQVAVSEGEIAQEDVYYKGPPVTYTSEVRTNQLRNQMAGQVEQIYHINDKVTADILDETKSLFIDIAKIKNDLTLTAEQKISQLRALVPGEYSDAVAQDILADDEGYLTHLENVLENSIVNVMQPGVMADDLAQALEDISGNIHDIADSESSASFLQAILAGLEIQANKEYDAVATAAEVERLMNEVDPVQVTVQSGEKILSRGSIVTSEQVEALGSLGLQAQESGGIPYWGLIIFVLALYVFLIFYLHIYHPKTRGRESNILLICAIINIILLLCRLLAIIGSSNTIELSSQVGYLMPIAAASMLLTVLLGRGVALFVTMLLSLALGVMMGGQLNCVIVAMLSGITGIFCTTTLNQRGEFVKASLYIVIVNVALIFALGLLNSHTWSQIGVGVILGLINGVFAAILTIGVLPFLESVFKVTTVVKLLELSNSNYPLLKRLMMEAPGTYHHSVLVGNLAEAAAQAVQADPLLVRVASYYHDIGKLRRPYFFIENQFSGENPHDKLKPSLSMLLISSHVKSGVEILTEAHFPEEIIDIVEQHHGTSVLSYFYHKAREMADDPDSINKNDFRYLGPNPQTKEAAIVMLADSVQAAVQSMTTPTQQEIDQKVREVIRSKLEQEQLQECPLTFKDLETIAQSFMKVLAGMHHSRIVYPAEVAKEIGEYDNANLLDDGQSTTNNLALGSYDIVGERSLDNSPTDAGQEDDS